MSSPKIVFINRYFWPDESATARMLSELAFFLSLQEDNNIVVYTSRQLYLNAHAKLPSEEIQQKVSIHRLWSTRFGRSHLIGRMLDYLTFYLSCACALLFKTDKGSIVVSLTDPPMLSMLTSIIGKFRKYKTIYWCQDLFPEIAWAKKTQYPWFARTLLRWRNRSFQNATAVITLGSDMQHYLENQLSDSTPVTIIPNWANREKIHPVPSGENPFRSEWELGDKFVIGYSGNLGRVHEYNTFLDAAEKLAHDPALRFLFIGSGALYDKLLSSVSGELQKVSIFKPYQPSEKLSYSLSLPDVHWISLDSAYCNYVFPSKFYGILAAGRPVLFIGDTQSEIAQIIETHEIGFTVSVGDSEKLAARIRFMKNHPEQLIEMGLRARNLLETNWDFQVAASKWVKMLHTTAGNSKN